jgi:hypothetical protein
MRKSKVLTRSLRSILADKKVHSDVQTFGFHIINVLEDDDGPPHSFSIGFYQSFQHPEVVIIGLKSELMQNMIVWMGDDLKNGSQFQAGKEYPELLEGFSCTFRKVAKRHYKEYLGYAIWFYEGNEFPVLQCVWPTTKGYFPWDKKYPKDLVDWQPLLD